MEQKPKNKKNKNSRITPFCSEDTARKIVDVIMTQDCFHRTSDGMIEDILRYESSVKKVGFSR